MELDEDASRAFWGAVAQIVPILALALVIETRVLVARWKSKKFRKHRASRWFLAGTYAVVILPLPGVLVTTLLNTIDDKTSLWEVSLVSVWVGMGVFLVAYIPAWALISVALYDLAQVIVDKAPWSRVQRLRRSQQHVDQSYAAEVREARGRRIETLIGLADVYMELVPLEIQTDRVGWTYALRRQRDEVHAKLNEIWKNDAEVKQRIEEWEEGRRTRKSRIDEAVTARESAVNKQMNRSIANQLAGMMR